mmetsp:Transcript_8632/g.34163  ORF Transcript_8632/g.34163 Transcript_8632/m.34163 type:complete len:331 (-) Transcript_8632:437-1429(-)
MNARTDSPSRRTNSSSSPSTVESSPASRTPGLLPCSVVNLSAARNPAKMHADIAFDGSASAWANISLVPAAGDGNSSSSIDLHVTNRTCRQFLQKILASRSGMNSSGCGVPTSRANALALSHTHAASLAALSEYKRCNSTYDSVVLVISGMLPSKGKHPSRSTNSRNAAARNQNLSLSKVNARARSSRMISSTSFVTAPVSVHAYRTFAIASSKFSSSIPRLMDVNASFTDRRSRVPHAAAACASSATNGTCLNAAPSNRSKSLVFISTYAPNSPHGLSNRKSHAVDPSGATFSVAHRSLALVRASPNNPLARVVTSTVPLSAHARASAL